MLAALAAAAPPPKTVVGVVIVEAGGEIALLEDFLEGFEVVAELELDSFEGLDEEDDLEGFVLPEGAATELLPETPPRGFGVKALSPGWCLTLCPLSL
jgi:hypothetical protein